MKSLKQSVRSQKLDKKDKNEQSDWDPLTSFSKQSQPALPAERLKEIENETMYNSSDDLASISIKAVQRRESGIGGLSSSGLNKLQSPSAKVSSPLPSNTSLRSAKSNQTSGVEDASSDCDNYAEKLPLIAGEFSIISLLETIFHLPSYGDVQCVLFMTNYRIILLPFDAKARALHASMAALPSLLQVPLGAIDKLERDKRSASPGLSMTMHCKDCRQLRLTLRGKSSGEGGNYKSSSSASTSNGGSDYELDRAFSAISTFAFPNSMKHLFAFSHQPLSPSEGSQKKSTARERQGSYKDLYLEYSRLGILDNNYWRVSNANAQYKLCATYPSVLVVPNALHDDDLQVIAGFRSGCRLPVLCWSSFATHKHINPYYSATLWRSSQPKVGKQGSCNQDERLLDLISRSVINHTYAHRGNPPSSSTSAPILYIVDCRSRTSAMANYAAGAGYESTSNYPTSKLDFYSIPNIHAVRDSLKSLTNIILSSNTSASYDISFSKQVEDTSWLSNLRLIIRAAWDTASYLSRGFPVLVHCSHGWDRTAQVCSLAEVLLDPYYRTMEGFAVLIEKEWCSFGHPFQMRCGHGQEKGNGRVDDEFSPIFFQFLDCLHQIHRQCAHLFEFNARYILTIAEHVYSCRFSTFLFNCDLDRNMYQSQEVCSDIWGYLEQNKEAFMNPCYEAPWNAQASCSVPSLPVLSVILRGVCLWSEFFLRYSSAPSLSSLPYHLLALLDQNMDSRVNQSIFDRIVEFPSQSSDSNLALNRKIYTQQDSYEALFRRERREKEFFCTTLTNIKNKLTAACANMGSYYVNDVSQSEEYNKEEREGEKEKGIYYMALLQELLQEAENAFKKLSNNHSSSSESATLGNKSSSVSSGVDSVVGMNDQTLNNNEDSSDPHSNSNAEKVDSLRVSEVEKISPADVEVESSSYVLCSDRGEEELISSFFV